MKATTIFVSLTFLSASFCFAQTRLTPPKTTKPVSATATKTSSTTTTKTTSSRPTVSTATLGSQTTSQTAVATSGSQISSQTATTTSVNPNRQQELYDQYHGITKKPETAPASQPAPVPSRQANRTTSKPSETGMSRQAERERQPVSAEPLSSDVGTSNVRIGVRGGVTYGYNSEPIPGVDPAVSFVGGLVLQFGKGHLAFQPELNYARYAVKANVGGVSFTGAGDRLEVPLFLKLQSGTVNSTRFFLNVGPYGAYLLNTIVNGQTQTIPDSEGRISYGVAAGLGAALKAGPGHVTVEARGYYQLGDNATPSSGTSNAYPLQATLGYVFPLGGR